MSPEETAALAQLAFIVVASLASLTGIGVAVHAYLRRAGRVSPATTGQAHEDRQARIEQAIDAIALEVERISENQRFLTRLQTERGGESSDLRALGSESART